MVDIYSKNAEVVSASLIFLFHLKLSTEGAWENSISISTKQLILFYLLISFLKYSCVLLLAVLGLRCCAWLCSAGAGAPQRGGVPGGECRLVCVGLGGCSRWAQLFLGTWNLPRPAVKPSSPELADRFLTTGPPGNSETANFKSQNSVLVMVDILSRYTEQPSSKHKYWRCSGEFQYLWFIFWAIFGGIILIFLNGPAPLTQLSSLRKMYARSFLFHVPWCLWSEQKAGFSTSGNGKVLLLRILQKTVKSGNFSSFSR